MAEQFWWYKDVPVHLDSFTAVETPHGYEVESDGKDARILEKLSLATANIREQAGTYHFTDNSSTFVIWRTTSRGTVLELRLVTLAADNDKAGFEMRLVALVFPAPIIPSIEFVEDAQHRSLCCSLTLITGVLYRFCFPQPRFFFTWPPKGTCTFYRPKRLADRQAMLMHAVDMDTAIIGCSDGTLIQVDFMNRQIEGRDGEAPDFYNSCYHESELVESNVLSLRSFLGSRILSSALPFKLAITESLPNSMVISTMGHSLDSSLTQAIALASFIYHESNIFVVALCRDRKLRFWSVMDRTRACVKTIELPAFESLDGQPIPVETTDVGTPSLLPREPPLPSTPERYLRIIEHETDTSRFDLIVYVPSASGDSFFAIYIVRIDASGYIKTCELTQTKRCQSENGDYLVDFALQRFSNLESEVEMKPDMESSQQTELKPSVWTIWTLWNRQRQSFIMYSKIVRTVDETDNLAMAKEIAKTRTRLVTGDRWCSVAYTRRDSMDIPYFDALLLSSSKDVSEIFADYIFRPGRFAPAVLAEALMGYVGRTVYEQLSKDKDIRELAAGIVGQNVVIPVSQDSVSPIYEEYRKQVKRQWLRYLAMCAELQRVADTPLSFSISPQRDLVMIMKMDGLSTIRACDDLEVLTHHLDPIGSFEPAALEMVPETALIKSYPLIAKKAIRNQLEDLLKAAKFLVDRLNFEAMAILEDEVSVLLCTPLFATLGNVAADLYERHLEKILEDKKTRLRFINELKGCLNLKESIELILQMLNTPPTIASEDDMATEEEETARTSILTGAQITSGFAQSISIRYKVARDLFITLTAMIHLSTKCRLLEGMENLYSRIMSTLHTYIILRWITEQPVTQRETTAVSSDEDAMIARMSGLRMDDTATAKQTVSFLSYSLIHTFLYHHSPIHINLKGSVPKLLTMGISAIYKKLGFLDSRAVGTTDPLADFAHRLQSLGYTDLAMGFTRFLTKTPSVMYTCGMCYLKTGEYERARDCFQRAAVAFTDNSEFMKLPYVDLSSLPGINPLTAYYNHVAELFRNENLSDNVVKFSKMALYSIKEDEQKTEEGKILIKNIWYRIFVSSLDEFLYEEAYMALISISDKIQQRNSLSHLIKAMCENDQVSLLCRFSFVGMQEEIERSLLQKARNSDVLQPPNYYKVLWSYHTFRGDFRNAGSIMYQYAQKLNTVTSKAVPFVDIISEQAKSYLAAINSLHLVDKAYAWIVIPHGGNNDNGKRKRQKLHLDTVEGASTLDDQKDLDIIELSRIRKEYTLTLAKLKLTKKYPELKNSGTLLEAADAVALFVQGGLYDDAMSVAKIFEIDLKSAFESLTMKCLQLLSSSKQNTAMAAEDWLLEESVNFWDGTASERAFKLLQKYLDQHDDESTNFRYRSVVVEKILSTEPSIRLPPWLVDFYTKHNSEDLIRICMKYELIEEAARFALQQIRAQNATLYPVTYKTSSRWLPYSIFDQLLSTLQDYSQASTDTNEADKRKIEYLRQTLISELNLYFKRVNRESDEAVRAIMVG